MPPTTRNLYIDALKGYAILLVVVGHAIQRTEGFGFWPYRSTSPYLLFSGYVTMPLFFAISGYLTFGRVRKPVFSWIGMKAQLLLIPWASWTLVYYVLVRDKFVPTDYSMLGYARSQLVSPSLWYFVVLFLCYVVLAAGFTFGDWSLPLLGLALVIAPIAYLGSLKWYWWWFIGGYFVARFLPRLLPLRWLAWTVAVPAYLGGVVVLGQNTELMPRIAMGLCAALVGTFLVWMLARTPLVTPLSFVGARSLEVYAGQFLFVQFLVVRSPLNAVLIAAMSVAGSLALGWLLRKNRWTNVAFLGAKKLPTAAS